MLMVMTRLSRNTVAAAAVALVASGCGEESSSPSAPAPPAGDVACPTGQVKGPHDACMAVGIQGCAAMFLGADGLCHPRLEQCPLGSIPKLDEGCVDVGIARCAPGLLGEDGLCHPAMAKCGPGTFAVPTEGCVPVDGPEGCGEGPFGNIADAPGTVYVDPARDGSGDGSRGAPVATLAEATALARDGGRIALAAGTYGGGLAIARSMQVIGRCASMVRLVGPPPPGQLGVVAVEGAPEVALSGLSIEGGDVGVAGTDTSLALDRLHIAAKLIGVLATDASEVTVTHSLIEGLGSAGAPANLRRFACGLRAESGGSLRATGSAVVGATSRGVCAALPSSRLELADSLVEATRAASPDEDGMGALVVGGSRIDAVDSAFVDNRWAAAGVFDRGSAFVGTRILAEGTTAHPDVTDSGYGAMAGAGASLELDASVIASNTKVGVHADAAGTVVTVARSLIEDTARGPDRYPGGGLWAQRGARMVAQGNTVARNSTCGINARGASTSLEATANLVESTAPGGDVPAGDAPAIGIGVAVDTAQAALSSNAIVGNIALGVAISYGATVTATENLVEGTLPTPQGGVGTGVQILDETQVAMARNLVINNRSSGVFAGNHEGSGVVTLTMAGDVVRDTAEQPSDGTYGTGLFALSAKLSVSSCLFVNNRVAGLQLLSERVQADIRDTLIDTTVGGSFLGVDTIYKEIADGILVLHGATVDVTSSTITSSTRAGLLYDSSTGSLTKVRASGNRFGLVTVGSPGPTIGAECDFADNAEGTEIRSNELPVPSGPPALP